MVSGTPPSIVIGCTKLSRPLVVSGAPTTTPPGAGMRGAKPPTASNDREALVRQYEEVLKQAGLAADRIAQLTREFRKTVLGQ